MKSLAQSVLENFRRNGFSADVVLDIGACVGKWTETFRPLWPEAKFLMIDAHPGVEYLLKNIAETYNAEYKICLLGREEKQAVLFYMMRDGSSIFPELTDFPRIPTNLPMRTLDNLMSEYDLPGSIFLKIDVQGAELEVLRGGLKTLSRAQAVLMEVPLLQYNEGAPELPEIFNFMTEQGFALYDISDLIRWPPDLVCFQADFLFLRKDHPLRSRPFLK